LQLVLQAGDPVPEIGPDAVVSAQTMGGRLSDNGTLFVGGQVVATGPANVTKRSGWGRVMICSCGVGWHAGAGVSGVRSGCVRELDRWGAHNDAGELTYHGAMKGRVFTGERRGALVSYAGELEIMYRDWQPCRSSGRTRSWGIRWGRAGEDAHGDRINGYICSAGVGDQRG
jgi:hypothetical protein